MAKKIGQLLLDAGVISSDQLEAALGRQRRFSGKLGTNILTLGYADEKTLALFLSMQKGVPFVVMSRSAIPLEILKSVPREIAIKHTALAVHKDGRELFVAMADPLSIQALDELRFVTGARVLEHGAVNGPLAEAITEAYEQLSPGGSTFWKGADLDPSVNLEVDMGHVEIVVGRTQDTLVDDTDANPSIVRDSNNDQLSDHEWVEDLRVGGIFSDERSTNQKKKSTAMNAASDGRDKATVLVVDDEAELRNMLRLFLEKSGYSVQQAPDGTKALEIMKAHLPDAIILDAMLPGIHGFDICYRIKNSEATRHIPVIMISAVYRGWRYSKDVKALYGADEFLEKPLRLEDLKHILQTALEKKGEAAPAEQLTASAQKALYDAAVAYKNGDMMGAAHFMKKAVAAAPFSAQLHHRLGLLYEKLGEKYRAIAMFERASELEPTYDRILKLARLYEKSGFIHKAYESWERCIRLCEDDKQTSTIKQHMDRLLG